MKLKKMTMVAVSTVLFTGVQSFAQSGAASEKREAVVDKREAIQDKRIEQGVNSGQLSAGEEKRLENKEANIKKMEDKAMSDGKMSKKEFHRIEKAQNQANREIRRKKHNKIVK